MNVLLCAALLLLFTPWKIKTSIVQLRPFDALAMLFVFWAVLGMGRFFKVRTPTGFLVLLPYFAWHVLTALPLGVDNALREGLQISIVVAFAFGVLAVADDLDYSRIAKLLTIGMIGVMIFNVGWHIEHGFWSGWKRLDDPKAAFTFLPLVVAATWIFSARTARSAYLVLWSVIGLVILLSGERKALLIFGVLSAMMLARGRILVALPVAAAGLLLLVGITTFSSDAYVARQVRLALGSNGGDTSLSVIAAGVAPNSFSDTQRTFAIQQAQRMVEEHPFIGVGTNGYVALINDTFAFLPEFMRVGIHGEFIRIPAENGLIGLALYLLVWIVAWIRVGRVLDGFVRDGTITHAQARTLPIIIFLPSVMYVAIEAPGTHSFVVLIIASLLPDLAQIHLGRRRLALEQESFRLEQENFGGADEVTLPAWPLSPGETGSPRLS